jgi:hypothetical protein
MTMTGSTKAATSSRMVAMVTDRSIRLASAPAGRGAAPAVTVDCLRFGGHGVPGRVRYQAMVAAMASVSGVPAAPNAAWYLLVSMTKGSPNW